MGKYKVGDIVYGGEHGFYGKDKHMQLTEQYTDCSYKYVGLNFDSPHGDFIYDSQIGGLLAPEELAEYAKEDAKFTELVSLSVKPQEGPFRIGDSIAPKPGTDYRLTGQDMIKGRVLDVLPGGDTIIVEIVEAVPNTLAEERLGDSFHVYSKDFVPYTEPKKTFVRMIGSDIGYKDGDVLELVNHGTAIVDRDGDLRAASLHAFEILPTVEAVVEATVTKEQVIEYLADLSAEDILDLILEANKRK